MKRDTLHERSPQIPLTEEETNAHMEEVEDQQFKYGEEKSYDS